MEGPFEWTWKHADNPTDRFELVEWQKNSDHERVGLRPLGEAAQQQQSMRWANIDDVKPADPTAPNFLEGVKILRDFKRYEFDHVRNPKVADFFEALTVDLDWSGSTTSDGSGPDERARYQQRARYLSVAQCGHTLSTFPEELRDAKACKLALEQDILAYPHVPLIHRTDALDTAFRVAKRAKLATDAAATEAKAKKEATAEKRRARDAEQHKSKKAKQADGGAQAFYKKHGPYG